ncbi:MAG: TIGR01777 family oxidoreductase [Methylococcaceae bacterium]|nr:TIGR01777 family oxidoreductase [Methylococcaceae bacterium]
MRILLTGATGFIGRALCPVLRRQGHELTVFARHPERVESTCGPDIATLRSLAEWSPEHSFDAVINLAGEPIMAHRWSSTRKQALWDSRVTLTGQLVDCMARAHRKPTTFISGSAIGVYGDQGDLELDENCTGAGGFGYQLCAAWEQAAMQAEALGIRVCLLRTGLVIGKNGGFLKRMLLPFRLGLGGRIGDGRQWMSWIHLADHVAMTRFLLDSSEGHGAFNVTAPHPVTNAEFTRELAKALKRPAVLPIPAWLLKLGAGEMAELLLESQKVLPRKALANGFEFTYATLEPALHDVLA